MAVNTKPVQATKAKPMLFQPITFRAVTSRNRIMVAPMCQYSATDGVLSNWHLVHLGSLARGGSGIVCTEATAVEPRGRITPWCPGLWNDEQQAEFSKIAAFITDQGAVPAIQLAHAGRKASTDRPWQGGKPLAPAAQGWQPVGPSALAFNREHPTPIALDEGELQQVVQNFANAARRAYQAGFKIIEVHAAHGYLLHSFLSPLSNQRQDAYGGSLENRSRLLMQVLDAVRNVWPEDLPLFVRLSCTDWVQGGWELEQCIDLALKLAARGDVDLVDCSSGGLSAEQQLPIHPGFQVPFAEALHKASGLSTGAVGLIRTPQMAEEILANGRAQLIILGRILLDDPHWPLHAARTLGCDVQWPSQYLRGNMMG